MAGDKPHETSIRFVLGASVAWVIVRTYLLIPERVRAVTVPGPPTARKALAEIEAGGGFSTLRKHSKVRW
jgi:hypothetical protein